MARPRPVFEGSDIEQDELEDILRADKGNQNSDEDSDDDFDKLSFGALKNAQDKMDKEDGKTKKKSNNNRSFDIVDPRVAGLQKKSNKSTKRDAIKETRYNDSDSESEQEQGGFFEEEDSEASDNENESRSHGKGKKKNKHAPTETSSKKKVSRVRQVPGLDNPKYKTLYQDIRFDTALGKADLNKIRKDYKFLDEYRENEINQINSILKNPKVKNKMSQKEINDLEYEAKSLKSRLDSLKNKDLQQEVLSKYKQENKGKNGGKFYLKKSEQRKIIQKHKFENMKTSQREKVVERKRKRRLGKEFKELEFNRPRN
ncbi:hypothetical protein BN7_220 [Wickerhamomyces ciferrii]|uniref:rRNA biogenesis protein RRP36 n=1 Tax=Wickerhamomyces ciferrii (strain ATCC 14091 / BCRC 22168 / CBS 111 / JCM 3599 / NBRC 0793 / NRRL Y-1031 F-60-10) TaxID=1206466 RepID=K0KCR9_WICCF|nr:uncharacterized protein BN7_220 [Wickerhamomyces ciferrii]CCH40686.1 hypothetical protein BN7_220 [Wickerhamomyces ciferrii]